MDINARVNWMPGMEITAQTFVEIFEQWDFKQQMALKTALGSNRMGLIPGAPFSCKALFVQGRLEIDDLQCMALLPSGRIAHPEENVQVAIPMLFGDRYYLTLGFGEQHTAFEKEGVPFVRPRYEYAIRTREETEAADVFPLLRFLVKDGVFSVDDSYIPPCLLLTADSRFKQFIDRYVELLQTLATHQHLASEEARRQLLHYAFLLKGYSLQGSMRDFLLLTQEIAQATDYHVVTPNREQPLEIPAISEVDVQEWLHWLEDYLAGAAVILDGVVLDDNTIDYDALLAQAKAELYEQLNPELTRKMLEALKNELHGEMQQLRDGMTDYINNTLKAELAGSLKTSVDELGEALNRRVEQMGNDLGQSLYEKLYTTLFDNLYNALYVPDQEDKYIPMI